MIAISRRLESTLRGSDIIGRLGGDEFVVLLQKIHSIDDAIYVAKRINKALKEPFNLEEHQLFTSASIGIAQGTSHYDNADELLRNADIAMYSAKAQGREGDYIIFDREMYEQVSEKLQMEIELRQALELHEFQLYYQPLICLTSGMLIGFEALVRWFSPKRGIVSPGVFIPIAEEMGLIVPLGHWILQEATTQLLHWRRAYPFAAALKMSVNLSIPQLQSPGFLTCLDEILQQQQWDGQGLQLEITESIFMEDLEGLLSLLQAIKQRGVELALDDFGTGYSCLSYLHRFPLDHLKIDRAFVSCIGQGGEQSEIAAMVINLAQQLGMTAIAEGIEHSHQRDHLQRLGATSAQGYWFAKPLNAEAAEQLLLHPLPWLEQVEVA
ncbi:MAG: bifunctional diguanylate cyclase/phosphodiesterase [Synechococcales cyanobacterium RM1_1_8]|nr:bifunctional diguanylate cyclase/phosphodiesterase [Synechococcales cyanobacterium RM1_1_8]